MTENPQTASCTRPDSRLGAYQAADCTGLSDCPCKGCIEEIIEEGRRLKFKPEHLGMTSVLDDVYAFLGRFVVFPSEVARVAVTLWVLHTHLMRVWENTPRLACLSAEWGSGKSRLLEVIMNLVPNPVWAVNVTSSYLFAK